MVGYASGMVDTHDIVGYSLRSFLKLVVMRISKVYLMVDTHECMALSDVCLRKKLCYLKNSTDVRECYVARKEVMTNEVTVDLHVLGSS